MSASVEEENSDDCRGGNDFPDNRPHLRLCKVYCIINTEAHPDAIGIVVSHPINEKLVKLGRFIRYVGRSMAPNNWY
jgi:hypothetical protein